MIGLALVGNTAYSKIHGRYTPRKRISMGVQNLCFGGRYISVKTDELRLQRENTFKTKTNKLEIIRAMRLQ